jgi:hypothetical protein
LKVRKNFGRSAATRAQINSSLSARRSPEENKTGSKRPKPAVPSSPGGVRAPHQPFICAIKDMRKIICPHCHAKNRRPKCGSCQSEIPEPQAIEFAWRLYEYRKQLAIAGIVTWVVFGLWRPWEFLLPWANQLFRVQRACGSHRAIRCRDVRTIVSMRVEIC